MKSSAWLWQGNCWDKGSFKVQGKKVKGNEEKGRGGIPSLLFLLWKAVSYFTLKRSLSNNQWKRLFFSRVFLVESAETNPPI